MDAIIQAIKRKEPSKGAAVMRLGPGMVLHEVIERTQKQVDAKFKESGGKIMLPIMKPGWVMAQRINGGEKTELDFEYDQRTDKIKVVLPPRWWLLNLDEAGKPMAGTARLFVELEPGEDPLITAWPFGNVYDREGHICWGTNPVTKMTGFPETCDANFFGSPFTNDYIRVERTAGQDLLKAIQKRYSPEEIRYRGPAVYPAVRLSAQLARKADIAV